MFPLQIHRPKSKFPIITCILISLNVIIFLFTFYSRGFENIIDMFAFKLGNRALWTWVSSMFLHADWFHLLGNMVFLFVFGSLLENVLSRYKYLLLYFVGGFASALVQAMVFTLFLPGKIDEFAVIGASGAIFALLAVVALRFRKNQVTWYIFTPLFLLELLFMPGGVAGPLGFIISITIFIGLISHGLMNDVPIWQLLTVWPVFTISAFATGVSYLILQLSFGFIQVVQGQTAGVAYWAHVGGIIGGLIMVRFLGLGADAQKEYLAQDAASLVRQGRFKEAAMKYEELLDKTPDPYFQHRAAKAWSLSGDQNKSATYFKQSFQAYYDLGKKEEASQVYEDLHNLLPETYFDCKLELKFASLCQTQYKLEAAIKGYSRIIEKNPRAPESELALLRKAQVYQKMGENKQSFNTYKQFLEQYPNSRWTDLAKQLAKQLQSKTA